MRLQILEVDDGKNRGVFIPKEEWDFIKLNYPDIDSLDKDLPDWQTKILDKRLETIKSKPDRIHSIDSFIEELDRDL